MNAVAIENFECRGGVLGGWRGSKNKHLLVFDADSAALGGRVRGHLEGDALL